MYVSCIVLYKHIIHTYKYKHNFLTMFKEGMGQLKIVPGGIQLSGQAVVMDMLRASTIRSRHGQPISIGKSRF